MIDLLTRYISSISLAIVATLSLFNIGYFWKIGIHFLGLIDLSNLVYSLGVSMSALFIGASLTAIVANFRNSTLKLTLIASAGAISSIWGAFYVTPRTTQPQLVENLALLAGFVLLEAAYVSIILRNRCLNNDWRSLTVLAVGWLATSFQAGMCQAAIELSDRFTYMVSTKSGTQYQAHILRSSSSGFLIAIDGRVSFIPSGEIKQVTSDHIE
ncbi:hypothetical protein LOC51_01980 [Rubrivivax sp. JA1024]|nr:hypothetical protein [Rubrivivax sp. JA1024]